MTQLSTTREYVGRALSDNGCVELRHQTGRLWISGWFDSPDAMLAEARARAGIGNLFVSLNAPRLRPVANAMTGNALLDAEVAFITRLPFDFDPVRPAGICSTEVELASAFERRNGLVRMLHKLGLPLPVHAKSGNGYHAVYRCRMPANAETREMLTSIYQGFHRELDDDEVSFDRSVRNPGRILRLYGSVNRKGESTPERPHRQSTVWIPPRWEQVKPRQIEKLAQHYARQAPPEAAEAPRRRETPEGKGDYRTLDVVAWFQAHGLHRHPVEGNVHSVVCPWSDEHTTPPSRADTVIFEADGGWPGFHCHHQHCAGRGIRDVMQALGDADAFCTSDYQGGRAS